jgi:hypothetical protein
MSYNVASGFTPSDGGTNSTTTISFTPFTSMTAGDLVIVYLQQRGTATFSVGVTGGQTWNSIGRNVGTTNVSIETYWCTFNGTWSANPQFNFSAGTCTSLVHILVRTPNTGLQWDVENISTSNNAASTTQTISGVTASTLNSITFASWHTADDNTWGNLTPSPNWLKSGLVDQYRNLAGQDQSMTIAHYDSSLFNITTIPNVSQTQLTLGADATARRIITFYETESFTGGFDPFGQMGFFGL